MAGDRGPLTAAGRRPDGSLSKRFRCSSAWAWRRGLSPPGGSPGQCAARGQAC